MPRPTSKIVNQVSKPVKDQGVSQFDGKKGKLFKTQQPEEKIILPKKRVKIRTTNRQKMRMLVRKNDPRPFMRKRIQNYKNISHKLADKVNLLGEKIRDKYEDIAFEVQMISVENPFSRDFYDDHCVIL